MSARPPPRRVVTGHDAQGRSVVHQDAGPALTRRIGADGPVFHEIWRTEDPAWGAAFREPTPEGRLTLAPPTRGTRIRIMDIPPEREPMTVEAAQAQFAQIGGAHALTALDPAAPHPLMHRTRSIDYALVLEGELVLILDREETLLRAGDVVVQRGTNHAWSNRGSGNCRVAFVLVDQADSEAAR